MAQKYAPVPIGASNPILVGLKLTDEGARDFKNAPALTFSLAFSPATVLFAIPRTVGWLAQWREMLEDPEQKISRPRQIYTGHDVRDFVPLDKRGVQTARLTR